MYSMIDEASYINRKRVDIEIFIPKTSFQIQMDMGRFVVVLEATVPIATKNIQNVKFT